MRLHNVLQVRGERCAARSLSKTCPHLVRRFQGSTPATTVQNTTANSVSSSLLFQHVRCKLKGSRCVRTRYKYTAQHHSSESTGTNLSASPGHLSNYEQMCLAGSNMELLTLTALSISPANILKSCTFRLVTRHAVMHSGAGPVISTRRHPRTLQGSGQQACDEFLNRSGCSKATIS